MPTSTPSDSKKTPKTLAVMESYSGAFLKEASSPTIQKSVRKKMPAQSKASESDTVRYTLEELQAMPLQSDLAKIEALTDQEIEQNALDDEDNPPITPEQWALAKRVVPQQTTKQRIALWIDDDILAYFGKTSEQTKKGYQTRLNQALRRVMVLETLEQIKPNST
ncbi:MAG: BrnA antitoxin family protein [Vampirovibrionales bacterium]|nr:BrnA antitoxin family protein [Vampirovibrionales bacterium]